MRRLIPLVPSRQTQQVQSKRPIQRVIGSAAMCCRPLAATSACSGEWRDAEAFRSTSALVGAADHGSWTVAALGAGDRDRLPLGPRTHSRPPAPACLFAAGFPVDERAMNFPSLRVDHGYLKVLGRHAGSRRGNAGQTLGCARLLQRWCRTRLQCGLSAERHLSYRKKCLHRCHLACSVDRLTTENHRRKAAI